MIDVSKKITVVLSDAVHRAVADYAKRHEDELPSATNRTGTFQAAMVFAAKLLLAREGIAPPDSAAAIPPKTVGTVWPEDSIECPKEFAIFLTNQRLALEFAELLASGDKGVLKAIAANIQQFLRIVRSDRAHGTDTAIPQNQDLGREQEIERVRKIAERHPGGGKHSERPAPAGKDRKKVPDTGSDDPAKSA